MNITGSFTLPAPLETTWDFLLDMERLGPCMPGVESVEALDDRTYRGMLKVQVGPIKAGFSGKATLDQVDPLSRLVATIEADDRGNASSVKGSFVAELQAAPEGTRVDYTFSITLRGRLAQFGAPVFSAVARKMTDQFVACLEEALGQATSS